MEKKKRFFQHKMFRSATGYALIAGGIVGLFLPIIQGALLIVAGLLILKPRFLRKHLQKFKVEFKKSEIKIGK
ncbi:hypothetical protein HY772_02025 [Candidatus Woesearchaeota archaeon]|nr:hypothetical protein [Candidatus Woesearchaeota archaeon]